MWAHCNSTLFLLICLATGAAVKQIQSNPFPLTLVITMHIICLPFQIFTYIGLVFPVILKSDLKCSLLSIRASLLNKYLFFFWELRTSSDITILIVIHIWYLLNYLTAALHLATISMATRTKSMCCHHYFSSYVYLKAILLLQSFVHTIVSQLSTWQFVICSMSSVLEPEGKMYVFHVLHSRMIHPI